MSLYFSPSAAGFFDREIHGQAIPADAVAVTAAQHRKLLAAQAEGKRIAAGPDGAPIAIAAPTPGLAERRTAAIARARAEARRRILAIASLERQSNDTAALALQALQLAQSGATTIDTAAALDRRTRIDTIRAASDRLETAITTMGARALAALDVAADEHWAD